NGVRRRDRLAKTGDAIGQALHRPGVRLHSAVGAGLAAHARAGPGPPRHQAGQPARHAGETNGSAGSYGGQSFPFGLIKILDLGLARFDETFNSDADNADPLTVAGQGGLRGSADYLAPEQAVDFHSADIRADVYSLGCVFYFLLAGKPPFDGRSLALKLMR